MRLSQLIARSALVGFLFVTMVPSYASAVVVVTPQCLPRDSRALINLPNFKDPDCQTVEVVVALLKELVEVALMFVLSVALIFLIISGYQFATAGGNREAMTKAKTSLLYITIGIIAVFSAYMLVRFVGGRFIDPNAL